MEIKEIFFAFSNGIHSLLRRSDTRGSANIIYVTYVTHISILLRIRQLLRSQSKSRAQYLIQADNIIS